MLMEVIGRIVTAASRDPHFAECAQCRAAGPESGTYLCETGRAITRREGAALMMELALDALPDDGVRH